MLTVVIFAIILFLIVVFKSDSGWEARVRGVYWPLIGWGFFFSIIGALAGGMFALILGSAHFPSKMIEGWKWSKTIELASLRDSDGVGGIFFLGSGGTETNLYYFYYEKLEDGGYRPDKIHVDDNVVVYEQVERSDGSLRVYCKPRLTTPLRWFVIASECKYEFFIPEGSIIKNFVLQ